MTYCLFSAKFRWILHGELYDPYHEFFISTNAAPTHSFNSLSPDLSTIDYVWHKYYTLNPGMLPPFLSLSLAKKILVVGKSINFMKACSKYSDRLTAAATNSKGKKIFGPVSIDHFTLPPSLLANTSLQNMSYGNESDLEQIVYSIARVIESTLLNIVQNQFHLSVHLSALKKFLLLGQVLLLLMVIILVGRLCYVPLGQRWCVPLYSTIVIPYRCGTKKTSE